MLTLVTGGSGSGKSAFAESLAGRLDGDRFYLATMEVFGEESRARVRRHRAQRAALGFTTIECPTGLLKLQLPQNAIVLLEDLSNLLANEMFSPSGAHTLKSPKADALNGPGANVPDCPGADVLNDPEADWLKEQGADPEEDPALEAVRRGIGMLERSCTNLTVVTNEVFSGGCSYEGDTLLFMKNLALLNREIASRADLVVEVVCGRPLIYKGSLPQRKDAAKN